jgi:MFS family permease
VASHRSLYGLDGLNFLTASMQAGFGSFVVIQLVANHWPAEAIGFALTISTVSSLVSQVPAGAFIDSIHDKRRAVRLGVTGVGVAALLLGLTSATPVVYFAQALQGLASSLIAPGIAAISLALVGDAAFSERVGRNARFASIGNGLTAGVMGLAGRYFAPASIFFVAAAFTVPALLSLSFIGSERADNAVEDPTKKQGQKQDRQKLTWKAVQVLLRDRRLLIFALCVVLFFASSAAMPAIVAAQVTKRRPELATLIVATTMLLPQAIVAMISPWIGRTAQRSGRRPMLLLGWGLLPVQGLLYATLPGPYALWICQGLSGVSGAVFGVMMTLVAADLTRGSGRFNLTLGALGVAISIGASLSTFFTGVTAAAFGGTVAYLGLALAGLCGVLLLWVGMPETHPSTTTAPKPASAEQLGVSPVTAAAPSRPADKARS